MRKWRWINIHLFYFVAIPKHQSKIWHFPISNFSHPKISSPSILTSTNFINKLLQSGFSRYCICNKISPAISCLMQWRDHCSKQPSKNIHCHAHSPIFCPYQKLFSNLCINYHHYIKSSR